MSIACGADESGDHRNQAIIEKWQKNFAAASPRLLNLRSSITERVAGQNEFRGVDGNTRSAGLFECGGKQSRAKTFPIRRQPVLQRSAPGRHRLFLRRSIVKQTVSNS